MDIKVTDVTVIPPEEVAKSEPVPVPPGEAPAEEPRFMTEEQLRSFKVVDVIGNGSAQTTLVLDSIDGIPLTMITTMTFVFAVRPMAVKVEAAIGYDEEREPMPDGRKHLKIIEVVYAIGRLMLCSNPRLVRMKHRGSKEWSLIAEFMDRLDNSDNTYYAVMDHLSRLRSVQAPAAPEETDEHRDEADQALPEA